MSATIKPEIFISWIPKGEIKLKPLIFATCIPAPVHEKNSSDLLRRISKPESTQAATLRRVGQTEKFSAQTKRVVVKTEKVQSDTSRKIGITLTRANLQKKIKAVEKNSFETCRRTAVKEKNYFGTKRALGKQEKISADTLLKVNVFERATGDLLRALREISRFSTLRKITQREKFLAKTVIRIPHILNYFVQSPPRLLSKKLPAAEPSSIVNTFKDYDVTAINITLNEKTLSDVFTFDIAKEMDINETVQGYLLDYPFHFLVEEITQTDLIRSVRGMYSVDDLLYTWFRLEKQTDINGEVSYPTATVLIKKVASHLGLRADIRIEDFHPSNIDGDNMITYAGLLSNVFSWTSRLPQRQVNVFIREGTLYCIQRGMEGKTFDISNLPHSSPTVNKKFNRVLCHNPAATNNDDDDDDENKKPYSGVIYYETTSCIMRYTYENGLLVSEYISFKSTNKIRNSSSHVTYKTYNYKTFTSVKDNEIDKIYYLSSKTEQTITEEKIIRGGVNPFSPLAVTINKRSEILSKTNYFYRVFSKDIYLFLEQEETTQKEYEYIGTLGTSQTTENEPEQSIRETYHVPIGNGWYAQTVYLDGLLQGANLSQGKPGNSVSQYTVDQFQKTFTSVIIDLPKDSENEQSTDGLSAIVDDSFPVRDKAFKNKLNEDLRWLHRKTVETVTVDLISPIRKGEPEINHIVDFTEQVYLDGKSYFLVSNNISFTPRKFIQKLQLIRWY